jgi:hypothetical protein
MDKLPKYNDIEKYQYDSTYTAIFKALQKKILDTKETEWPLYFEFKVDTPKEMIELIQKRLKQSEYISRYAKNPYGHHPNPGMDERKLIIWPEALVPECMRNVFELDYVNYAPNTLKELNNICSQIVWALTKLEASSDVILEFNRQWNNLNVLCATQSKWTFEKKSIPFKIHPNAGDNVLKINASGDTEIKLENDPVSQVEYCDSSEFPPLEIQPSDNHPIMTWHNDGSFTVGETTFDKEEYQSLLDLLGVLAKTYKSNPDLINGLISNQNN